MTMLLSRLPVALAIQMYAYETVTRTLDWFLRDKRCQKWIVQCSSCLAYGRRPETPITIPKFRFEEMFPIMELNADGKCEQCQQVEVHQKRGANHVA